MDETTATETIAPTIAPEENLEDKLARVEAEKAKILEEKENYRKAYLKETEKSKEIPQDSDDDKLRRIAREELQNSRLAELAQEQDELLRKAIKENTELKRAKLSTQDSAPPAAVGTHSEAAPVRDTSITPEQMAYFKNLGWTDKDIERYRANLRKKI